MMASDTPSRGTLRPFVFMDFAGEIRNRIYRECLLVDRWTMATSSSGWGLSPTILRLSRQIYNEAHPILWAQNDWLTVEGHDQLMNLLERRRLGFRRAPESPSPSQYLLSPVVSLTIGYAFGENDPAFGFRWTRLVHIFELPALCRAILDLPNLPEVKASAFVDTRKPKATALVQQLVNWSFFNTAWYDRNQTIKAIHPRTRVAIFGAKDEVTHMEQGERLDLPWYHPDNISAAVRMWQHRIEEVQDNRWLQRCIHLDHYQFLTRITSLAWFLNGYDGPARLQWQLHVLHLAHQVARASLDLNDTKHAENFLAQVWRWGPLGLDGTLRLKGKMAESHYLMFKSLTIQGQHTAALVHLVQALMLDHDHAKAIEAATNLMRDYSAVPPGERVCFILNLRNILDPVMWGLPVERSRILVMGRETLHFMNFIFPLGWQVRWEWDPQLSVPFVHLRIEYPHR